MKKQIPGPPLSPRLYRMNRWIAAVDAAVDAAVVAAVIALIIDKKVAIMKISVDALSLFALDSDTCGELYGGRWFDRHNDSEWFF